MLNVQSLFGTLEEQLELLARDGTHEDVIASFKQAFEQLRRLHLTKKLSFNKSKAKGYGLESLEQIFINVGYKLSYLFQKFNDKNYEEALVVVRELKGLQFWYADETQAVEEEKRRIKEQIVQVDRDLVRVIEENGLDDPVDFINITNEADEKVKFLEALGDGKVYNPVFEYDPINSELLTHAEAYTNGVMRQLRDINVDLKVGWGRIVEKKRINIETVLKLIRSIGNARKITKYSKMLYGFPSDKMIEDVIRIIKSGNSPNISKKYGFSPDQIKAEFTRVVESLGLDNRKYNIEDVKDVLERIFREEDINWTVVVKTDKDMLPRWKTVNVKREIWINKNKEPFSKEDIVKCIQHEVRAHIIRSEKGGEGVAKYGTGGYLPTEEALAGYNEAVVGVGDNDPMSVYAYVVAESVAAKGSFYDCYLTLANLGISEETIWKVVVRIKRGLSKTKKAGGFFKDHVYYLGDRVLKQFIASGGDVEDLKEGKIGVNDVEHIIGEYRL